MADLYAAKHAYIFWAQIVMCIQLDFAATCVFVYFEYIQIFIFSLHSTAAHALTAVLALVCSAALVHTGVNTAVIELKNPKTSHIILCMLNSSSAHHSG